MREKYWKIARMMDTDGDEGSGAVVGDGLVGGLW
jgi:hypothetical protein